MAQYFGYGVAAVYRGPLLYETDAVRAVIIKWVSFFKEHRDILISDIVHVRRPDGQGQSAVKSMYCKQLNVCILNVAWTKTTLYLKVFFAGI